MIEVSSVGPAQEEADYPSLATALERGIFYDRTLEDGRICLLVLPGALDAIQDILDRRQRHLPVPDEAIAELQYWQQHLCTGQPGKYSRRECTRFVDGPHMRCHLHQSLGQVHPGAHETLSRLSPRARKFFDWFVATEPDFFGLGMTRTRHVVSRFGMSSSTVNRAIEELDEVHLAWRNGRWESLVLHPAVAFFGPSHRKQSEALDELRLDRRQAFAHLEPPVEEEHESATQPAA